MFLSRRQTMALVVLVSLTAVGGGLLAWRKATRGTVTVDRGAQEEGQATPGQVIVHVCGAVKSPGVYVLSPGARVFEAIAKAGGALPDANQEAVNLAARLMDGEQIMLPRKGQALPAYATPAVSGSSQAQPSGKAKVKLPLHLNQASAAELEAVPGIGPTLAARIVAYREANGPFAQVEDLLNVSGIGQKTLDKLRPYLLVP